MAETTRVYGVIDTRDLVFREQFTGNASDVTFQLTNNIGNAAFEVGSWSASQIQTSYPSHITGTNKQPIYDSVLPILRHRINISSISSTGLVTLDYAPLAVNFYIWYWYTLTPKDHLSTYHREDFVASMEEQGSYLASEIYTDTTNFDSILSATEDTAQKSLDILDDHLHTAQTLENDGITPDSGTLTLTGNFISDGTLITDNGTYVGEVITVTVDDASAVFGNALYQAADLNYERTLADSTTTMPALALALESGSGSKKVLIKGIICDTSWNWIQGPIYISESAEGELTQVIPSGVGDQIQIIGYPLSSTTVLFNPSVITGEVIYY